MPTVTVAFYGLLASGAVVILWRLVFFENMDREHTVYEWRQERDE